MSWRSLCGLGLALTLLGCPSTTPGQGKDAGVNCPAGTARCGEACVDLRLDDAHCGACGVACRATEACADARCLPRTCDATACAENQVCVDNAACLSRPCVGVVCPTGQTCRAGACEVEACGATPCARGSVCIDGACTDVACVGVTCPAGKTCRLGACTAPSGCDAGVQDDVANCGACGVVCPTPLNASARCSAGRCGRGGCAAGFFDVDGDATPGCEARCEGRVCTLPDGGTLTLSAAPLPDTSAGGLSAGAAVEQVNGAHRHTGALGEGPGTSGAATNAAHRNIGGITGLPK